MEQVEVLKGPQSAYFGRSVLSGAVNYVTRSPNTEEFQGRVTASTANYDTSLIQVSLEGSINDTLAIRVSASHDDKGGHYTNASNRSMDLGATLTDSVALQVQFQPSENLTAKGFLHYMRHEDGPPAQASLKGSTGDFNCDLGGVNSNGSSRLGYICGKIPNAGDLPPVIYLGFLRCE